MAKPESPNYEMIFPLKNEKANIFWPVYVNLEQEFTKLSFNIFIDDNQLKTYSYKISELILRAAIEIESISKELYFKEGGNKNKGLTYDDALKVLDKKWSLSKKVIKISSSNIHLSKTEVKPFSKILNPTKGKEHYRWNIAYQNIKHDRAKFIEYANLENLIHILSALFILNLYYNNEEFELEEDWTGQTLYTKLNTELFAVSIHGNKGLNFQNKQNRKEGYEESLYYVVFDDKSKLRLINAIEKMLQNFKNQLPKSKDFDKFRDAQNITELYGNAELSEKIGEDRLKKMVEQSSVALLGSFKNSKCIARINKNDI